MNTEPDNTTPEEAAPVTDGGVAVVEEVAPEQAAATSTEVAKPAGEDEDFLTKVAAAFEGESADEVVKHVAVADIEGLQGKERGIVRALIARRNVEREADAAKIAEREAAVEKRMKELEAAASDLKRQQAALYSLATSPELEAARRGQKPTVDPLSPEGVEALAAYNANVGVAKALDPIFQRSAQAQRDLAYAELTEKYPVIKAEPEAFKAFMASLNEGIKVEDVRAGKATWRVDATIGARMFAAEQEAAAVKKQMDARKAAEVADRGRAAAAIHRTAANSTAQPDLKIPDEVYQRGEVHAYLAKQTPERRAAMLQYARNQASA